MSIPTRQKQKIADPVGSQRQLLCKNKYGTYQSFLKFHLAEKWKGKKREKSEYAERRELSYPMMGLKRVTTRRMQGALKPAFQLSVTSGLKLPPLCFASSGLLLLVWGRSVAVLLSIPFVGGKCLKFLEVHNILNVYFYVRLSFSFSFISFPYLTFQLIWKVFFSFLFFFFNQSYLEHSFLLKKK